MNKILTAIDIDNNKRTLNSQIEEAVNNFNKLRIRKKLKEYRDNLKIEFGNDEIEVPKEITKIIQEEIENDDETKNFRAKQKQIIYSKSENYQILRQTLQNLNELNEFSTEVERNDYQKISNFQSYYDLVNYCAKTTNFFINVLEVRKKNINLFIEQYKNKKLNFKDDELDILLKIREFYKIDKTYDDIELYEKFNMETNIDYSNKLSNIYFHKLANNKSENLLNELQQNFNNPLEKLIQKQIISTKLLSCLLLSGMTSTTNETNNSRISFVSNNAVTCLKNMFSNNINNDYIYNTRTLGELLFQITNDDLEYVAKINREQIYMTYDGTRPSGDEYYKWNGLQVFDIDLKSWNGNIEKLKKDIHSYLIDFHWFLWICKSPSGNGIHIYTKVTPPHHIHINANKNEYISKYWFTINYAHKISIIYDTIYRINKQYNIFPKKYFSNDCEFEFSNRTEINGETKAVGLDNVVSRITAGIRLTYDSNPIINNNFLDLQIGFGLSQTIDGLNFDKTIKTVLFRQSKFNNSLIDKINELSVKNIETVFDEKESEIDKSKFVSLGLDIDKVSALPKNRINYVIRYNVCNTLASLFGKDGLQVAHTLLNSTECGNVSEINSFYSCALSNRKEPSKIGLDILKKAGIVKSIEPETKEVVTNIFKNGIKKSIESVLTNKLGKQNIELLPYEYLYDKRDILLDSKTGLTNSKINIIFSPPGSGKTEMIKYLAIEGKRILLVLPYISVIKNKIETDPSIMKLFDCYYGTKDIKQIEYGINAVTTFDKFSRANYEKISKMFDYVFIDESHLLFTSSYRIEATSNVIKKIKELFYISSNDPFAAKLCLLTGTETGESYFFGNVANIIRVTKRSLEKNMLFLICDDVLDTITRLSVEAVRLINDKNVLLIPTNKGEIYSEKIIGMLEYLLGRPIKYGYYKRSNTEQEICRLINNDNTVGDYEIIFCSNYLSVGVDINDNKKFASIYFGPFSGYEIEQFNARVRRTGIESIYCLQTQKSDGTINDLLLEEPDLVLKLTEEDVENFRDDKAISSAKQEFIAQYDSVLHKITTPGFSYLNGKIQFNVEEYELISFENKYNECMQHPTRVARELSKYGYNIKVSTDFESLSISKQEELKAIGIQSAKEEKIRKHSLLVGTFIDLINNNSYINQNGLEFTNIISWIGKNNDLIFEDRLQEEFIKIDFDIFASPLKCIVKSKEALDLMLKPAKYLISKYSVTKCLEIINNYVDDTGILKQKNFKRAINLLKLVDSSDANELTIPMTNMLEKMYEFVDKFEISKEYKISYNTYQATVDEWTNSYIDMLGIKIFTTYGYDKIKDGIMEMLADISTKNTSKNGIRFNYNKLPDQDSSNVLNRRSVDSMIQNMFNITTNVINENKRNKKARERLIILQPQNF